MDPEITQEVLQKKFAKFGNILSMVLYMDDNGGSKGFGFVNFENPNEAKQAMEAMHGLQLGTLFVFRLLPSVLTTTTHKQGCS